MCVCVYVCVCTAATGVVRACAYVRMGVCMCVSVDVNSHPFAYTPIKINIYEIICPFGLYTFEIKMTNIIIYPPMRC